jgi:hypothetical protein
LYNQIKFEFFPKLQQPNRCNKVHSRWIFLIKVKLINFLAM